MLGPTSSEASTKSYELTKKTEKKTKEETQANHTLTRGGGAHSRGDAWQSRSGGARSRADAWRLGWRSNTRARMRGVWRAHGPG